MSNVTGPDTIFRTSSDLAAFWLLGYVIVASLLGAHGSMFSKRKKTQNQNTQTSSESVDFTEFVLDTSAQQQHQPPSNKMEELTTTQWLESHSSKILFYPPNWVFPVVWICLYFLMMVSFFLFFRRTESEPGYIRDVTGILILVTLLLNKFWPIVFFQYRMPAFALVIIFLMLASVICLLIMFGVHGDLWISFGLLIPYNFWLLVACYLNISWIIVGSSVNTTVYNKHRE